MNAGSEQLCLGLCGGPVNSDCYHGFLISRYTNIFGGSSGGVVMVSHDTVEGHLWAEREGVCTSPETGTVNGGGVTAEQKSHYQRVGEDTLPCGRETHLPIERLSPQCPKGKPWTGDSSPN